MKETAPYQPQSVDTTMEADQRLFQLLRQQTVSSRVARAAQHSRSIIALCLSGIKRRHPHASLSTIREKFAIAKLGQLPPDITFVGDNAAMWVQDSISLARDLDQIFEEHQILYYVTDGVAASTHGEPRSTIDLDLVVQLSRSDIDELVDILTFHGFYCPQGAVDEVKNGVRRGFQATHQISIANVDIYLPDGSEFSELEMARRLRIDKGFYVSSPEDTVLQKLRWRRFSQSEKQWRDVLGILKLQQGDLDSAYMAYWAQQLGISDDLNLALQASWPD